MGGSRRLQPHRLPSCGLAHSLTSRENYDSALLFNNMESLKMSKMQNYRKKLLWRLWVGLLSLRSACSCHRFEQREGEPQRNRGLCSSAVLPSAASGLLWPAVITWGFQHILGPVYSVELTFEDDLRALGSF